MAMSRARLLCIGKDPGLLRSRRAVLVRAGYDAHDVMFYGADDLLRTERFELIILSAILTDEEKAHIVKIMDGSTPILSLKNMVLADALLREIERRLAVHGATSQ